MIKKKKILVLTDDMPWGHRSIAKAIFNYFKENEKENNFEVVFREIKANIGVAGDLYTFNYRYLPKSNKLFHNFLKNKLVRDLMKEISILNLSKIKKEVETIKPDLVISSYFFHSHSLARWRKRENKLFKLWTIVADPWTITPISFVKDADLNIVYDNVSLKEGQKWGLDKKNMMITGWWTRGEMYKNLDYVKSREKLGFMDDRPVIFVGGGSLGMNSLPKLLPTILTLKQKVGFVINTGTDKMAFNLVNQFVKVIKRFKRSELIQIKHLGWIDNMAEVLGACDIVFGKAGPNFLFDVVACQKPFVAMTHIGGQEDGNIELIKKKKLGWVREKNVELVKFLYQYLDNPKHFEERFKKTIEKEALANKNSLEIVLDRAKKDLELK
jgi:UDP-N-acetylglucosamine:LPS N-acetylglucosamine transferase